jgi:hypothetical protein
MFPYGLIAFVALLAFALRGHRWAYVVFVALALLYFPARVGFRPDPQPCEVELTLPLALHSLQNYKHIVLLALFFLMTRAQFPSWTRAAYGWSALLTLAMGVWLEIGEAVTGRGHCRVRDLVPDTAGILLGAAISFAWDTLRRRPANPRS